MTDAVLVALIVNVPVLIGILMNGRRGKQIQKSVGPANGESLIEMVASLKALDEYQHARNHDLINALTRIGLGVELLVRQSTKEKGEDREER